VSLSDSKPGALFFLLECVRSFLLVSPDSQYTFEPVCVLSRFSLRAKREFSHSVCAQALAAGFSLSM
jgi:hypothetical protein